MEGNCLTIVGTKSPISWLIGQICIDAEPRADPLDALMNEQMTPIYLHPILALEKQQSPVFQAYVELQDGSIHCRYETDDVFGICRKIEEIVLLLDISRRELADGVIHVLLPAGIFVDSKIYSSILVMPCISTAVCILTSRSHGDTLSTHVRNSVNFVLVTAPKLDEIAGEITRMCDLLLVSGITQNLISCLEAVNIVIAPLPSASFVSVEENTETFEIDEMALISRVIEKIHSDSVTFGILREVIARILMSRAVIEWMGCACSVLSNIDQEFIFRMPAQYQNDVDDAPNFVLRFLDAILARQYDHGSNDNYFSRFDGIVISSFVLLDLMKTINRGLSHEEFGPDPINHDIREIHLIDDGFYLPVREYFRQLLCEIVGHSSAVLSIDRSSSVTEPEYFEPRLGKVKTILPKGSPEVTLLQMISNTTQDIMIMSFSEKIHEWFSHDPVQHLKSVLFLPTQYLRHLISNPPEQGTVFSSNPTTLHVVYDADDNIGEFPWDVDNLCVLVRAPKTDFVSTFILLSQRLQTIPVIVLPSANDDVSRYRVHNLDTQPTDFVVSASTGVARFIDFIVSISENCRPGCEIAALTLPCRLSQQKSVDALQICDELRNPITRVDHLKIGDFRLVAFPTYMRPFEYFKRRLPACGVEKSVEMCLQAIHAKGRLFEITHICIEQ